jgi:hypothetical protein
MVKPLAIDLFCGLGGWTAGLLATGWHVCGVDIERHVYGGQKYPGSLWLQDVLTLHGSQFAKAGLIVASPPCQRYSYMAMPWTRAKAQAAAIRADETGEALEDLNRLFNACFRIQREACEAAGRHIPMVVENVRGAIPWVGRSRWNFGSFHFWGDTPALMPPALKAAKVPSFRFNGSGKSFQTASVQECHKTAGMNWSNRELRGQDFTRIAGMQSGIKGGGGTWFGDYAAMKEIKQDGLKQGGDWFSDPNAASRTSSSKSPTRKAASAMIAKIPLTISTHIGRTYHP